MIDWIAFLIVVATSLTAACLLVTLYSLALRFSSGTAPWHRFASVSMYVLCGIAVLIGIYLIVPALHH
ncbi:MAG: hypothetical protein ACOH1T_00435 [Microbacteriaceae bacterium]